MYTRYDYTTTAKPNEVHSDVCKILGGETNKANLSASCQQASTTITATQASGWQHVHSAFDGIVASTASHVHRYVESSSGKIYRSNPSANNVSVLPYLNTINNPTAEATIATSANPTQMVINNSTNRLYVLCTSGVVVINTLDNSVVTTISLAGTNYAIAISTALNKVYVGDNTGINVIDCSNNTSSKVNLSLAVGQNGKMCVNNSTGVLYFTSGSTLRKMVLSNNTASLVYTANSTLYDVVVDPANNVYYTCGTFAEGVRVWGFDGATDARQASAFATPPAYSSKLEIITATNARTLIVGYDTSAYLYDLDSKNLLRTVTGIQSVSALSALSESVISNGSSQGYRIDCHQTGRALTINAHYNVLSALNADGLTYKYIIVRFDPVTGYIYLNAIDVYSVQAKSLTYAASDHYTSMSVASLGGTLFIGSSPTYAFLSGWINGTFQGKAGVVERTRDSAWDTPAYGVSPILQVNLNTMGAAAPRAKTLAGADLIGGGYTPISLLMSGANNYMVLVPDASFVAKNPVVYLNYISSGRGDLGGRALGFPLTTSGLGTNLDEIIYNGNVYVLFVSSTNDNRLMIPKF
jgi:hypothetical protein